MNNINHKEDKEKIKQIIKDLKEQYEETPVIGKFRLLGADPDSSAYTVQLLILEEIFNSNYLEKEEFINNCLINKEITLGGIFVKIQNIAKLIEEEMLRNENFREQLHNQIQVEMKDLKFLNTEEERLKYKTDILTKTYKLNWQMERIK
jgi:hypothetical protein